MYYLRILACIMCRFLYVLCADFSTYYVQIFACLMWIAVQTHSPFGSFGSLWSLASVHVFSKVRVLAAFTVFLMTKQMRNRRMYICSANLASHAHWQKMGISYNTPGIRAATNLWIRSRQARALTTHEQKPACPLQIDEATLVNSCAHSSFGRPRRLCKSNCFITRSSLKTSCHTEHVCGRRANVPKYTSWRSKRISLSTAALTCANTSALVIRL